ncbi:hypothetical protein D3C85_797690 [compost metagenome]
MKNKTTLIFSISAILVTSLFLFNCSNDSHDDNVITAKLNSQSSKLGTVPIENSLKFFEKLNNKQLTKRNLDSDDINLEIDLETIQQVDITNTEAKINIATATTKFSNVETEILQIEMNGELQTVLLHHISDNSNTNKKIRLDADFTGDAYTTDLDGRVISGYKINKGTVSGSYNPSIYSGDPIRLREVVITNSYRAPVPVNSNNTMMDYQFVRSTNNYSSMGIAYAGIYRAQQIKKFDDQIDDKLLRPCLKAIIAKLKSTGSSPGNMVMKFSEDWNSTNYKWNVKSGTLDGITAGNTSPSYSITTGITTTFDSQGFRDATDLSWAKTILHEAVHAYLVTYFKVDRPGWLATYPAMVQDWGVRNDLNAVHHEEIARSLVKSIGVALEAYGVSQGYNLTKQFYEDMAWGGLQESNAFKALPKSDQNRILNTLSVELTGMDVNGDYKSQKGKKAGC